MIARLLPLVLSLAAAPAFAAPGDLAPCRELAEFARRQAADPVRFRSAIAAEYGLLAPRIVERPSAAEAANDAALHDKVDKLFGIDATFALERVGGEVWRASALQGTANCTYEWFFRRRPDGGLETQPTPSASEDLCWTSRRDVALVDGRTALVEVNDRESPALGMDVEITPWDGDWKAACRVSLRYADTFQVSERFCPDKASCTAGAKLSLKLAQALAREPKGATLSQVSPRPRMAPKAAVAAVAAVKAGPGLSGGRGELVTFGAKAKTEFPNYSDTAAFALVDLAGRPAVAHVGLGGVGWRPIGDYLIVFFSADPRRPRALASFVVERQAIALTSAEASTPKPYVSGR